MNTHIGDRRRLGDPLNKVPGGDDLASLVHLHLGYYTRLSQYIRKDTKYLEDFECAGLFVGSFIVRGRKRTASWQISTPEGQDHGLLKKHSSQ